MYVVSVYHQSKPQCEFNPCLIAVGQDDFTFGDTILRSSNVPSCGERGGEMYSVFSGLLFLNEYSKCLCIRHWKKLFNLTAIFVDITFLIGLSI